MHEIGSAAVHLPMNVTIPRVACQQDMELAQDGGAIATMWVQIPGHAGDEVISRITARVGMTLVTKHIC